MNPVFIVTLVCVVFILMNTNTQISTLQKGKHDVTSLIRDVENIQGLQPIKDETKEGKSSKFSRSASGPSKVISSPAGPNVTKIDGTLAFMAVA